jgi:phenylacetate-coenzyme A ligase PaaK-like adenylate-forming protein
MISNKYTNLLWLMRNEKRSVEEIRDIQNAKLRRLVRHAYENVPAYRELFRKSEVRPEQIRSAEDLERLPIIDKNHFHGRNLSDLIDRRSTDPGQLVSVKTSGSSGVSLKFYIDHAYDQFRKAQYLRPYLTNGRGIRDRVLRLMNTEVPRKKWFQYLGMMREAYLYSDSDLDRQIAVLADFNPTIIQGFGSSLALLAGRVAAGNTANNPPRVIFTDSELLSGATRDKIETAFKSRVIDVYGSFETDNIAYECDRGGGYHIASDCVIMEFLKSGKRVPPGGEGEIVCTVLDNFTMPFIRYNLHDTGSWTDQPCSCGRPFPLMKIMEGRSDDFAVYAGGLKKSPRAFLGLFDPLAGLLQEYQIVQEEINRFEVKVVPDRGYGPEIGRRIKESLRKEFPEAVVEIVTVPSIDRGPSKKLRAFVCKVEKRPGTG